MPMPSLRQIDFFLSNHAVAKNDLEGQERLQEMRKWASDNLTEKMASRILADVSDERVQEHMNATLSKSQISAYRTKAGSSIPFRSKLIVDEINEYMNNADKHVELGAWAANIKMRSSKGTEHER